MPPPKSPREPRRIKSIEVGFRILRLLEQSGEKLPLRDIAAGVGMPPSNAYLYLASFVYEGVAEQDPATGRYGLGPFAVQLGGAALRQSSLVERAKDLLTQLRDQTRNSASLAVWGNRGPTIVFHIDGAQYGPMGIRVGNVLPVLSTATGRVFLSWLPAEQTGALIEQERAASLSLAGSFDARIRNAGIDEIAASVRAAGWAQTDPSMAGGFAAAAAPVFDQTGHICAAVTTIGPERQEAGAMEEIGRKLREVAEELSKRLGGGRR
ncbi:Glycerol operon regulatory protein [Pigmentiphaga humi]|uniref:Glycerol operon regulatory protein n=1 Tax=Pigmentiphaga humi TaxID=2478468 RepID=A0A3P4B5I1_9BURK|nr:IclR family transcriptional regulator [Pigmentiphaga humi]VCU70910.1 Glycerol operon regulatory protein [Pigmentiphaga humi]